MSQQQLPAEPLHCASVTSSLQDAAHRCASSHTRTPSHGSALGEKHPNQECTSQAGLILPTVLGRPSFRGPTAQAISSALGMILPPDITLESIRSSLSKYGPEFVKCASNRDVYVPPIQPYNIPKEITITLNKVCLHRPDYLLAVHSLDVSAKKTMIPPMIFPICKIFVAAFCANIAPFGPSTTKCSQVKDGEWEMTLPVFTIAIPDPQSFHLVLQYIYLRTQDIFFSAFIPGLYTFWDRMPSSLPMVYYDFMADCTSEEAIAALAEYLGAMLMSRRLLCYIWIVLKVRLNVSALGVFDDILWNVLEGCYQVLRRAFELARQPTSITRPPFMTINNIR